MATSCIDKILCENAWGCNITVVDTEGNPVDPLKIQQNSSVVFILGDKPGYYFAGWVDENGNRVIYQLYPQLGNNAYLIPMVDCSKQYFATYCPITYNVQVTADAGTECFHPYIITASYGDVVTIAATEGYGCRFVNWTKDDIVVSEERSFEYVVTESVTFVAHYDSMWYRITAKPDRFHNGTCTGSGVYVSGTTVTIAAVANDGHTFVEWDDGNRQAQRNIVVNGNKTYIAHFTVEENIVRGFPSSGGTVVGTGTYRNGSPVTLQAIAEPGWTFSHWLIDGETYQGDTYSFISYTDSSVTPVFTPQQYRVTAIANGNGYFSPDPTSTYTYGQTVVVEAIPITDYEFVAWEDGFTSPKREITVTSDVQLVAIFAAKQTTHMVTVRLPDNTYECGIFYLGSKVSYQNGNNTITNATEGTVLEILPSIPAGKRIVSVTDSSNNVVWNADTAEPNTPIRYTVGDSNAVLTVNYANVTYRLSVTAEPLTPQTDGQIHLTVSVNLNVYDFAPTSTNRTLTLWDLPYGTTVTLSAPSDVGLTHYSVYKFSYWKTSSQSMNSTTLTFTMKRDEDCCVVYNLPQAVIPHIV